MEKEEVCRDYLLLAERIAEEYADRHVPNSTQAYYLLAELIACGSIKCFVSAYGHHEIDTKSAAEGKQSMDLGELTPFEIAAAEILNEYVRSQ